MESKDIEDIIALTPMQEGMLFHYLEDPGDHQYFEQLSLAVSGEINTPVFEQAWNVVTRTNEMLRTVFRWEKIQHPVQIILKSSSLKPVFVYYDFPEERTGAGNSEYEKEKWLEEIKAKDRNEMFDLEEVPFRVTLCKIDDDTYRLIISNHHILYDGWSTGIILNEFFRVYQELVKGNSPILPVKTPFKAFVDFIKNQDVKKQEKYWTDYLKNFTNPVELPVKVVKARAGSRSFRIRFAEDIKDEIQHFAAAHKITFACLLYVCWGILLQKYGSCEDVVFGTTVSGRSAQIKGIEEMVGLFINTQPLRIRTRREDEKIIDLLYRTNESLRLREDYEWTSLVKIKEYSEIDHNRELFDSIVIIENYPLHSRFPLQKGGLTVHLDSLVETSNYDLAVVISFSLADTAAAREINFIYDSSRFEKETIVRMSRHFHCIVRQAVENPGNKVADIEIISEQEKEQVLYSINKTVTAYPRDKTIHQLFEEQAEKKPDGTAVIGQSAQDHVSITYKELDEKSNQTAHVLREKGVGPDIIVGLMVERSLEMIIGILGILKAGGAYLPIDSEYPEDRINYMLADSNVKVMVGELSKVSELSGGIEVVKLSELSKKTTTHLTNLTHPTHPTHPTQLCYVIYTSGTTGKPKGNLTSHMNVVRVVKDTNYIRLTPEDRLLQLSNYAFDGSVFDIYGALLNGAALVLIERDKVLAVDRLAEVIQVEQITVFFVTTALFNALVELDTRCFKDVRKILFGGERVSVEHSRKALEYLGKGKILHVYGPTEATVYATFYFMDHIDDSAVTIPIGKPIANTTVYILDKYLKPVPPGIPGEIYVGGDGTARGYLNNPELTAKKFVLAHSSWLIADRREKKVSSSGEPPMSYELSAMSYLYKTGDLARWLRDANIEFLGRRDSQIKIRGFRVELGEIESRLSSHQAIREALVISKEAKNERYLCAYIVADLELSLPELRRYLARELPDYMIPSYFKFLEKMPLTPNGKVDLKALPEPEIVTPKKYAAPRNKIERKLLEIWSEVLGHSAIGIDDNFFEVGGHSLKATILLSRIHKTLDIKIPLKKIFERVTIRSLSEYLTETTTGEEKEDKYESMEPVEEKEFYPLSPAQKRLYILQQMENRGLYYNISEVFVLEGELDLERIEATFKKLIHRHESLRTSFQLIDKQPVQRIHDEPEFGIEHYNLTTPSQLPTDFVRSFDLSHAPLLRAGLVKQEQQKHLLMVDLHHIIADGTSIGIMIRDFTTLYEGRDLPALKIRYRDYARWQQGKEQEEKIKQQEAYWLKEFAGDVPAADIPTDYPRAGKVTFTGKVLSLEIEEKTTNSLKEMASAENVTLFMLLLAAFNVLLWKLSPAENIVVGTAAAGRNHADLEGIIGMFVHTLALRNQPHGEKPFPNFLEEVKEKTLAAFENQEYPFELLVEKVKARRESGRNPIFDVMFALHNMEMSQIAIPGLTITPADYYLDIVPFDIYLTAEEKEKRLTFKLGYSTRLFKQETVESFFRYYREIIDTVIRRPSIRLKDIEISRQLLEAFNNTDSEEPQYQVIHRWFEQQVERTPERIALVGSGQGERTEEPHKLTYRELNEKANQLAHELRIRGMGPNTVAAIILEPSIELITVVLAVLKAGGAYLPIDLQYPAERVISILNESNISLVLTRSEVLKKYSFTALQGLKYTRMEPHMTLVRPQSDFDRMPHPDRGLIDCEKYSHYIGHAMVRHAISIQGTRGCPYLCAYCHRTMEKKNIPRSAENIFEEVNYYYHRGVRRFAFVDEIFNLDAENSSRFFQLILKHRLKVQLFFPNGMRADRLTKEYIDLMVEAGTVNVGLALETASPRLQKLIKKNLDIDKLRENAEYFCSRYPGVIVELFTMHGFPSETEEEAMSTLDFIKSLKWIHFPYVFLLKIHPSTDMMKLALESGISPGAIERSMTSAFHEIPETLPYPKSFTRQYVARFMNEYFLSKERLLHVLPLQMKIASEEELVGKYDSYLPADIKTFDDIIANAGITREELGNAALLRDDSLFIPDYEALRKSRCIIPAPRKNALRVLLLDLSVLFSSEKQEILHGEITEPLGLMYLLTFLNQVFADRIAGKMYKAKIDFDNYEELKSLVCDFKPHLIGIRTLSYFKDFFHKTVTMIKEWGVNAAIIAGGPYGTSDYRLVLQDPNVDLTVLKEGELTLAELVEQMMAHGNKLPPEEVLETIKGIAFIPHKDREKLRRINRELLCLDRLSAVVSRHPVQNPENTTGPGDLLYLISTSGSTGRPRSVMLEHRNLANLLHFEFTKTSIDFSKVLQFASIGFDVSAQEIFSTLLSGGELYLITRDMKSDVVQLCNYIRRSSIEVLFLPPAFVRFIFSGPRYIAVFPRCVKHIITAGEQLIVTGPFRKYLQENRVVLHNHYGPAETHVVTTFTMQPTDSIAGEPSIGSPISNTRIYILDENRSPKPVGAVGELYIAGANVGRGYLNKPELTAEKFVLAHSSWLIADRREKKASSFRKLPMSYELSTMSYLYKTGDLARWLPDGTLEFIGRVDHQVKIRGFRIEPGEVDHALLEITGVKEAVVIDRSEPGGDKYLCAYVVPTREWDPADLREVLSHTLPDYMIPAYFVQVERIPLTPNGKINRNALPVPELHGDDTYAAPKSELEKRLAAIWSDVLSLEQSAVSAEANFFDLGGHSLKATILISQVHKELDVKVTLGEVFEHPTISKLAKRIEKADKTRHLSIPPAEEKEYYNLSPAQRRLYILQQMDSQAVNYNLLEVLLLEGELDKERFEQTFKKLMERHKILRTSFQMLNNQPVQKVEDTVEFEIEFYNLAAGADGTRGQKKLPTDFVRSFDLSRPPLLRVGLMPINHREHILMMDMHHIITDGTSMGILVKDFTALYENSREALSPLKLQYKDYSEWQNKWLGTWEIEKQKQYWLKQFEAGVPVLNMPTDFPRPLVRNFKGSSRRFEIDTDLTGKLRRLVLETGTTLHILFLAVQTLLLWKYSGQKDIVVGTGVAGRKHADLEHVIGMFINMLAIRSHPEEDKLFTRFLEEVKIRALDAYENQDFPFDELVKALDLQGDPARNPLFDTVFQMQNIELPELEIPGLMLKPYEYEHDISRFDLVIYGTEKDDTIALLMLYSTELLTDSTAREIGKNFLEILNQVADDRDILLKDISISIDLLEGKTDFFKEKQLEFGF
ncbi:MAG: amino acid adenylation domain-containing protein [Candidatus Aminicenantes bacterium]|nr:amino acid adenylation domain-containing protein [Candidatus Aminicenantes bacterium]NIM78331.1 amino acid adenylation domain-containing protein [Candidatus Aminicenantes bacterium]NIN17565.1 amino acid adenylation domain-containing protein [Candidatus Aminicenantes bacterium]NIN41448.1 amino acid adenylation domain-containing protein [Candidatus Aminicenantes bacterium]NIN84217.1 amino acid adenylation domain-containing protein [Candidatus Aminicenantes bacterium]